MALKLFKKDAAAVAAPVKKKKKHKRWPFVLGGAVVVLVAVLALQPRRAAVPTVLYDDTTVLADSEFSSAISATGTVESDDTHKIYSTQSYTVQEVYVEVGDTVTADTLLCQLDAGSLEDQIATRETATGISAQSAAQQVKTAQDAYNAAQSAVSKGENSSLVSAESSVRTSKENYDRAVTTYNNYKDSLADGLNSTLIAQDSQVDSARLSLEKAEDALDNAEDAYRDAQNALKDYDSELSRLENEKDRAEQRERQAQEAFDASTAEDKTAEQSALDAAIAEHRAAAMALETYTAGGSGGQLEAAVESARSAVDSCQTQVDGAQISYDNAVKSREAAYRTSDTTLADYATAVDTAKAAYDTAQKSYAAAKASVSSSLQQSYNSLASAQISANTDSAVLELAQLQQDLDDTSIRAGVAGTVTAVYATVGSTGSGLLFVIEDVDDLIVETSVKEYDVANVTPGMPVTIKSEATGNAVYDGQVVSVAPTSTKTSSGDTATSGDVEFAVKVKVTAEKTALRIGMSVRLSYILDQQSNVLLAPYDAVYRNSAGQTCVLALDEGENGLCTIRELPVTKGAENDLDVIISGDGVSAGLRVLNDPDEQLARIGQTLQLTQTAQVNPFAAMG